jgi:ferritin-like metal-binding protein YciE
MKTSANKHYRSRTDDDIINAGVPSSKLSLLFEEELRDIYWAENELAKAIPRMIKYAISQELIEALELHLAKTKDQIKRVEHVFEILGKKASSKKCEAMDGLIRESQVIMEECDQGAMLDAGIISAAQKIDHYEIASYGTLSEFAKTLKFSNAAELLAQSLIEEKSDDARLTALAVNGINVRAEMEIIE